MSEKEMRELDVWIAINLYGWEWLEREHNEAGVYVVRKALFCPTDSKEWARWNHTPAQWTTAQESTLLFSDWDTVCAERDDDHSKGPRRQIGLPRYTTDPAAAMQVLEKCIVKLGCEIHIEHCGWWMLCGGTVPTYGAPTLPLAIALFAKAAFS